MESSSKVFAGATRAAAPFIYGSWLPEDCGLAQATRLNLLLINADGVIQGLVESFLLDRREQTAIWRPGNRLILPPVARSRTMILHDVGDLPLEDQHRLATWLEGAGRKTQIVSTAPRPLLPSVEAGTFDDTLYYRLNMVCVDVGA
jgi:transcriptional regulator of acetoin/glycerol metabolism